MVGASFFLHSQYQKAERIISNAVLVGLRLRT